MERGKEDRAFGARQAGLAFQRQGSRAASARDRHRLRIAMNGDLDATARVVLGVEESSRVAVRPRLAKTGILGNAPGRGRTCRVQRDGGRAPRIGGVASCSLAGPGGERHNAAATPSPGQRAGIALRLGYRHKADDGEHGRERPILPPFPNLCIAGFHVISP